MSRMTGTCRSMAAAVFALAVCGVALPPALAATPPSTAASDARVSVTYANPEQFTEARTYGQQDRFNDLKYLEPLKTYLIKRATKVLPPGDHLDVTITDIKLAGGYEPWHGPNLMNVRFMKDVYPPRIDLTFKLTGSDGGVLREGERKLRNLGYLQSGAARATDTDPLRYDKALLDSWLRREFKNL